MFGTVPVVVSETAESVVALGTAQVVVIPFQVQRHRWI